MEEQQISTSSLHYVPKNDNCLGSLGKAEAAVGGSCLGTGGVENEARALRLFALIPPSSPAGHECPGEEQVARRR